MSIHYKFTISKISQFSKKSWCFYYENITDNGSNWDNLKCRLKQKTKFLKISRDIKVVKSIII